jgi:dihydropteroate synthase
MIQRKLFEWRLRSQTLTLGERTLVAGVILCGPDGLDDPDRVFARALEMEEQGADLIHLASDALQPGSARPSEAEEIRRVVPAVKRLRERVEAPLIVETWRATVAAKVLEHGAAAIHDLSGLTWDPALAKVAVQSDAGLVLTHLRGTPSALAAPPAVKDMVEQIATGLAAAVHRANRANVSQDRLMVDAGLGFAKRREHNLEILGRLRVLGGLNLPVSAAPAAQAYLTKDAAQESAAVAASAVLAAIFEGAHVVRVNDVAASRPAVLLADALLRASADSSPVPQLTPRAKVRASLRH